MNNGEELDKSQDEEDRERAREVMLIIKKMNAVGGGPRINWLKIDTESQKALFMMAIIIKQEALKNNISFEQQLRREHIDVEYRHVGSSGFGKYAF